MTIISTNSVLLFCNAFGVSFFCIFFIPIFQSSIWCRHLAFKVIHFWSKSFRMISQWNCMLYSILMTPFSYWGSLSEIVLWIWFSFLVFSPLYQHIVSESVSNLQLRVANKLIHNRATEAINREQREDIHCPNNDIQRWFMRLQSLCFWIDFWSHFSALWDYPWTGCV